MSDHSHTESPVLPEPVCAVFQENLYRYYPHYRGTLTTEQWHQLYQLAKTITSKTDSTAIWQTLESNPLVFMYFRYQTDRIQQASGKPRSRGLLFSVLIFIMGAVWSWGVNEIDPTLVYAGSFLAGFLGPMAQKGLEKIKDHKRSKAQDALNSQVNKDQKGE
jgi:hypothetical protein